MKSDSKNSRYYMTFLTGNLVHPYVPHCTMWDTLAFFPSLATRDKKKRSGLLFLGLGKSSLKKIGS